jgi:hypothetical protein
MNITNLFDLRSKKQLDQPDGVYMGIECEIESVFLREGKAFRDFQITTDNSLRNHGVEFISVPLKPPRLLESFRRLHSEIEYEDHNYAFTPRTSTHIHLNCRHMEELAVRQMLYLYVLFEKYFFLMVDPARIDNIHCVPLSQTVLHQRYNQALVDIVYTWHKYTAFNLLPLKTQGSVEFRHLHGTDDAVLLERWLSCITNLQELACKQPITRETLCDRGCLVEWLGFIFVNSPYLLKLDMDSLVYDELLELKMTFM